MRLARRARLIKLALVQEELEQQRERPHGRQAGHQALHVLRGLRPVGRVEADVQVKPRGRVLILHDWHLRLADDLRQGSRQQPLYTVISVFLFFLFFWGSSFRAFQGGRQCPPQ